LNPNLSGSDHAQEDTLRETRNPKTQKELLDWFRHAPAPMPRTQPELFQCLATYNPRTGWDAFLETIDFSNVTPRQVYQVVLGRHPGTAQQAVGAPGYNPERHFREVLVSPEFRKRFLGAFLRAYQSKGRDVFIHVPKCAGTDLILNLGGRSIPLPKMLEIEGWTDDVEFLEIVAGLARVATAHERLFVYGHMELGGYIDIAGVRPDDCIFTVLRDPIDLMVSQANYAVGRVRQDPTGREPDAANYLHQLGLTHLPDKISAGDLKHLTFKALLDPSITKPNVSCFFLGRGSSTVFATALENLIIHNVEVTTTKNYDRWLKERWGIASSSHHNRSEPLLPNAEARRMYGSELAAASAEDQKLFDVVSWALQQTGTASVTGQQLAQLIGPPLTEALRTNECPLPPADRQRLRTEKNILVAESAGHVEMYLAPAPAMGAATAKLEPVLTLEFGDNPNSERYRLKGWATAEKGYTWTDAQQSTIALPTLAGAGGFIVRLVASPFVVPQRRPFQQLEVMIDGVRLGTCQVKDISVIEVEVPAELLAENNRLTLTLNLPTATRPSEVSDSKDHRQLALAIRSLAIYRVSPAASRDDRPAAA
jgi:hypothetical protein